KKIKDVGLDFAGGLHGIEHAMIGIMPFHVMCDRWDLGGKSTPNHPDTMKPTIFVYDGFEGGIGLTEKAFELIREIVKMTFELVRECKCEKGCPACIYSPKCGNENKPLDKKATILILDELLKLMEQEDKIEVRKR
ncbi:MAG: Zn-binding domain-containing protein, partial [Thermoplasmata archaeon]